MQDCEEIRSSVVVNGERPNKAVGKESFPTFCSVTGHATEYFNKVPRYVPCVYL